VSCPSIDELADYAAGRLSREARDAIQEHAADCALCRLSLSEIARPRAAPSARPSSDGADETVPAGGTILERYAIQRRLGVGAMGTVHLAHDTQLDRMVALKMLHRRGAERDAPLLAEARALARVRHPNVVTVFDAALNRGRLCIVMEYVDGETLRAWVASRRPSWKRVLGAFLDAGRGLAAAHAVGVAHGDFKPDNVLMGRDGRAQVSDFGLARPPGAATGSAAAALSGTPAYMAPEQLAGAAADARSDQFSFCVSLYEMLLGRRPFVGGTIEDLQREIARRPPSFENNERLPRAVLRALGRGLALDPQARYPSMDALGAELADWRRRRRLAALSIGALALAALVVRAAHYEKTPLNRICRVDTRQAGAALNGRSRAAGAPGELEAYVRRWVTARVGACEDADATAASDPIAHARYLDRLRCFDDLRRRVEVATAPESGAAADTEARRAAAARLPAPESCLSR
jgi:hypothetical protein